MQYKLSKELLNLLIRYLASRPFSEVYSLINELQQLKPVQEDKPSDG